jgi:hypothetical protein
MSCRCPATRPAPLLSPEALAAAGGAERVAVGDLTGDGQLEIVYVDDRLLWVVDASGREVARIGAPGGIHVLRTADLDGEGRDVILAGWGISRAHRDARPRMSIYRLRRGGLFEESLPGPEETTRAQIEAILPLPGSEHPTLLLAYRLSTYVVRVVRAARVDGSWEVSRLDSIYMATSYAVGDLDGNGRDDIVVGRVYGEGQADGDAFALRLDGSRVSIPTLRGVRGLAVADLDGDGRDEILLGDGWHQNYGERAEARLSIARFDGSRFVTELIDDDPEQFTIWDIIPADFTGDGQLEIATRGDLHLRVFTRDGARWRPRRLASGCRDMAVVDPGGGGGASLLALCEGGARLFSGPTLAPAR